MSQENVDSMPGNGRDVMRRWVETWNRRDFDAFFDLYDLDGEVMTDPSWMEPGPLTGRAAIRGWFEGLKESWEVNTLLIEEVFAVQGKVVLRFVWEVRGRSSGIETELHATSINVVEGGAIVRQEYYFDHKAALAAVGLSE